jgi:hypothetical protein
MGLDMYFYTTTIDNVDTTTPSNIEVKVEPQEEMFYYRKHNRLNGWLENLYKAKDGEYDEFNCCRLLLTKDDLKLLRSDITHNRLRDASGFFWGDTDVTSEVKKEYNRMIRALLLEIENGKIVYFTPSY